VFQDDFVKAFSESGADEVVLASVFRSTLADDERLSVDEIVRAVTASGKRARHIPTVDEIVATIAEEAREGDIVIVMSNGGFGGIHEKLLAALGERGRRA
jgi:UDP-N-acetylmuramate: L-alanyl-gamma-D-glutamyl-meso-diaminopimelate ligase